MQGSLSIYVHLQVLSNSASHPTNIDCARLTVQVLSEEKLASVSRPQRQIRMVVCQNWRVDTWWYKHSIRDKDMYISKHFRQFQTPLFPSLPDDVKLGL